MTTLIDRYVFTVLRRVPEKQRADIDRELRASIDDAVDARVDAGEPREAAVEATLLELGEPDRLADGYADRPLYLIGPELFPIWRRLMIMLFSIVLPIVLAVAVITQLFQEAAVGPVFGTFFATLFTTGAHLAFWTTAVFAVLERTGNGRAELGGTWTLASLPKYDGGGRSIGQLAGNLVWPVLLIAALVLQQFTFSEVPVLEPGNWSFWWPFVILTLVLKGAYAFWVYRKSVRTHAMTAVNTIVTVLFSAPLIWLLATHRFYNLEFLDGQDWGTANPQHWLTTSGIILVVGIAIWDIVDVAVRVERDRRGLATRTPGTCFPVGTN